MNCVCRFILYLSIYIVFADLAGKKWLHSGSVAPALGSFCTKNDTQPHVVFLICTTNDTRPHVVFLICTTNDIQPILSRQLRYKYKRYSFLGEPHVSPFGPPFGPSDLLLALWIFFYIFLVFLNLLDFLDIQDFFIFFRIFRIFWIF